MTRTGPPARPPADFDERAETVFSWIQDHTREVAVGTALLAAAGIGGWLYVQSRETREQRAYESLERAELAVNQRNFALGQSDLEKVARRFRNTAAGDQAVLRLSEVLYATGKYQQGIKELERIAKEADADLQSTAEAQIAAGYEELRKFGEAADHYSRAAEKARFAADSAVFMAAAARAYTSAGNTAAARKIWAGLAQDENNPVAGEARVRLGELEARAARST
jgi:predicted negative regulator of RcsB-dependent stress response